MVPAPHDPWPERDPLLGALLRRRIVLVSGLLTNDLATSVAAQIMALDAEDDDAIELHIASPDGDLDAALMLADTVDLASSSVTAVCRGALGGPALGPLAAAQRRVAHPHATFRMSDARISLSGRADEVAVHAAALQQQVAHLHGRLAAATGQPASKIAADLRQGLILSADQARDYGLVHEVARGADRSSRSP
ncbi:MAG: ATP-dependent Clp protease proteolytic subunit [Actinomycetota bacterium]|nr:ATP-dependent Clp protease proteolytic subunit [Actinomycetota bacterium]